LNVVHFANAINLAVNEGAYHVDEAFDGAKGVVGMREYHLCLLFHGGEDVVIPVALFEIFVSAFVAPADEVDGAVFCGDGSGVKRDFELHLHQSLFELTLVHLENVSELLVPLEGVDSAWDSWSETVFDVVINSEVGLNQVLEVRNDLLTVLVQQSLQL